uniref:WD_REPEATS_REGION domain-containing protein n=1 Tax=Rhabditophanes sp. KR3021 TaxID=114890 RepID=A0AC35UHA4_9BILA
MAELSLLATIQTIERIYATLNSRKIDDKFRFPDLPFSNDVVTTHFAHSAFDSSTGSYRKRFSYQGLEQSYNAKQVSNMEDSGFGNSFDSRHSFNHHTLLSPDTSKMLENVLPDAIKKMSSFTDNVTETPKTSRVRVNNRNAICEDNCCNYRGDIMSEKRKSAPIPMYSQNRRQQLIFDDNSIPEEIELSSNVSGSVKNSIYSKTEYSANRSMTSTENISFYQSPLYSKIKRNNSMSSFMNKFGSYTSIYSKANDTANVPVNIKTNYNSMSTENLALNYSVLSSFVTPSRKISLDHKLRSSLLSVYSKGENFDIQYDTDTGSDSGEQEILNAIRHDGCALTHEMIYGIALRDLFRDLVGSEVRRKLLKQINYSCSDLLRNLESVSPSKVVYVDPKKDLIPQIITTMAFITSNPQSMDRQSYHGNLRDSTLLGLEAKNQYENLLHMIQGDQDQHFERKGYLPIDFTRLIFKMACLFQSENSYLRTTLKDNPVDGREILKKFKPTYMSFVKSITDDHDVSFDWKNSGAYEYLYEKCDIKTLGNGPLTQGINEEDADSFLELVSAILLSLPSMARRRIQLFIKFMGAIQNHSSLKLKSYIPNRYFLLHDFSSLLIDLSDTSKVSSTMGVWATVFLFDNYSKLFSVPNKIEATVTTLNRTSPSRSNVHSPGKICLNVTECHDCIINVSKQLHTNLNYIEINPKLTAKEKKRQLEIFKLKYPSIYFERFPKSDSRFTGIMKFVKKKLAI